MKRFFINIKKKRTLIALALIVVTVIRCGKDEPTGPGHETVPPTLLYTNPANNDPSVEIDILIRATFSEPINAASVSSNTFYVNNGISGNYSFSGNTVILTPSSSLVYSTVYTATLTTGITDTAGNHLTANHSWSFTAEPDPATTHPTIVSVFPIDNSTNIPGDVIISVTFSKDMDPATINSSSFILNNSTTGAITYGNKTATYTPDDTLEYLTDYVATITTAVTDTFGNNLQSGFGWNFTTGIDPLIPVVTFANPFDSAIIDDTVTIAVDVSHPVGVNKVEFYVDDIHILTADDLSAPYEYLLDASGWSIGSVHTVSVQAYDGGGHIGYSDTLRIIYLWELLMTDNNSEGLPQDLRAMYARSTESVLELRYEYSEDWTYPYPVTFDQLNYFHIDLGIYLDADLNPSTGDSTFGGDNSGIMLNGIGADNRIIIGLHGGDTALAHWVVLLDTAFWNLSFDTTGFNYHNVPIDTNTLEFGIDWSDLGSSYGAHIVNINVHYDDITDTTNKSFTADWLPNRGAGFVTVAKEGRYLGAPFSAGKIQLLEKPEPSPSLIKFNPFE